MLARHRSTVQVRLTMPLTHILSIARNENTGDLTIQARTEDGETAVQLTREAAQQLVDGILSMPAPRSTPPLLNEPIAASELRLFGSSLGLGIRLILGGAYELPVLLPEEAIPSLHRMLDELAQHYTTRRQAN